MKPDARVWRKTRRDAIRGIKRGRRPRRVLTHVGAARLRADRRMAAERARDAEQALFVAGELESRIAAGEGAAA